MYDIVQLVYKTRQFLPIQFLIIIAVVLREVIIGINLIMSEFAVKLYLERNSSAYDGETLNLVAHTKYRPFLFT